jgi:hypothetical protein
MKIKWKMSESAHKEKPYLNFSQIFQLKPGGETNIE